MKHTQGDWNSRKNPMLTAQLIVESEDNVICQINYADFETDEEAEANATLISLTPQMLELLYKVRFESAKYGKVRNDTLKSIDGLINKGTK